LRGAGAGVRPARRGGDRNIDKVAALRHELPPCRQNRQGGGFWKQVMPTETPGFQLPDSPNILRNHPKAPMARTVQCIKLGKEAEGLDFPPYPGELGKRIWESVSKEAWAAWLKHQTMLVNENRLNLADLKARQYLARQMENHFFGGGADAAAGYVPPSA
jgi:Fe-S cluster biosynthesis and repair protein YggX